MKAVVVALVWLMFSVTARAELYDHATLQHEDTGAQTAVEHVQPVLGVPFLAIRAALVLPGAALGELGNGVLWLLDRPSPGSVPHAESGWLWNGALGSLRDDWNESTPGS
jgi:hypothetical protein